MGHLVIRRVRSGHASPRCLSRRSPAVAEAWRKASSSAATLKAISEVSNDRTRVPNVGARSLNVCTCLPNVGAHVPNVCTRYMNVGPRYFNVRLRSLKVGPRSLKVGPRYFNVRPHSTKVSPGSINVCLRVPKVQSGTIHRGVTARRDDSPYLYIPSFVFFALFVAK
jgi:hypothetical protein